MTELEKLNLRNMTTTEMLRYVDRANPEVKELAERLETALMYVDKLQSGSLDTALNVV